MFPSGTPSAGLLTDENGQVKHRDGHPIPGLYASGNATAHTEYGAGYQAGMTLAGGMVFSYRAVREGRMDGRTRRRRASTRPSSRPVEGSPAIGARCGDGSTMGSG